MVSPYRERLRQYELDDVELTTDKSVLELIDADIAEQRRQVGLAKMRSLEGLFQSADDLCPLCGRRYGFGAYRWASSRGIHRACGACFMELQPW